eukprot:3941505-Rhodomonas_salina.5
MITRTGRSATVCVALVLLLASTADGQLTDSCCVMQEDFDPVMHTSTTVCCRASNCSMCEQPKAKTLLDGEALPSAVEVFLEPYAGASEL